MVVKVKDLIEKLKKNDQNTEVEFIVVGTDGMLVCMDVKASSKPMVKLLKTFST